MNRLHRMDLGLVALALGIAACSASAGKTTVGRDPSTAEDSGTDGTDLPGEDAGEDEELDAGDRARCGDGVLAQNEPCDDGNRDDADGCSASCELEPGFACPKPNRACLPSIVCGDGTLGAGEQCDDGNGVSGDGCTDGCKLEANFACEAAGQPCRSLAVCGDARVVGSEQCDDGNTLPSDGCDGACQLEPGYACQAAGRPCRAAECGDGILAGNEECEDGNGASNDGCAGCKVEDGFVCSTNDTGSRCRPTTCNDGTKEGSEPCDDGNQVVGDGCNPYCEVEPDCNGTGCESSCGDGIKLPSDDEACDDGNTRAGDGCSATCTVEPGFACRDVSSVLSDTLEVPVTFRDMIAVPRGSATRHPDFEHPVWEADEVTQGLVQSALGADGKPVYTGICQEGSLTGPCPYGAQTTSRARFDEWYRDTSGVNVTKVQRLTLRQSTAPGDTSYHFPTPAGQQLYPFDGDGWVAGAAPQENTGFDEGGVPHNFGFTTEIRYWFEFKGGEQFTFSGDDDVWVFVSGKLALDMGGLHPRVNRTLVLEAPNGTARCYMDAARTTPCATATRALGLTVGRIYELVLFHAERHTTASNFDLTLAGFVSVHSECATVCGDGIATADEACDDGTAMNTGAYDGCTASCELGPHCGDRVVQATEGETCDDGTNLTAYGEQGCAPGCVAPPRCGDGQVDANFGERCDDAVNDNGYGSCTPDCQLGPRCGDGEVQGDEACDDGNTQEGDGCSTACEQTIPL